MHHHLEGCTIFAVDFDGTLCEHKYPEIGAPNMPLIQWLIERQKEGDKLILWTNRVEPFLSQAMGWCREHGLIFDAVNDNLPEIMKRYEKDLNGQSASRKITADVFIDDAACSIGLPFNNPGCMLSSCWHPCGQGLEK